MDLFKGNHRPFKLYIMVSGALFLYRCYELRTDLYSRNLPAVTPLPPLEAS